MSPTSNVVRLSNAPSLSWDDCQLLVQSVVDYAIFMLDVAGNVATWSAGAERIKGYSAGEIIGQHFSKFYLSEDIAAGKPERELAVAMATGRAEDEGWRLRKDGSKFWANVVITALRDESGALRGFGKVTRDLTVRKAAEEQVRLAEQRFHQLIDGVVDYAIFMLDETGHVSTWNSGARRVKGYAAEEIVGRHFSTFYAPEDRAAGKPERILEAVRRDGRYEDEGWRVRKDGSRFWANVVISALRDDAGNTIGFAKVTRDLTQRRHTEEELRRSEERFRLLVDNLTDYAIYSLDPSGRVTTWNLGAERMKGYTAAEAIGQSFERFFPQEDVAAGKPAQELASAVAHGRFEDEAWRVRKDGSRFWADAIVTALRDSSGELLGFAKITRDLTPRREAEDRDRRLLKEQTAREVAEEGERRLRESEARYRALSNRLEIILEGVADGITVQDRTGRVIFANSAAAKFCGLESGEALVATPPGEVVARFDILDVHGQPLDPEALPGRRVLAGGEPSSAVIQVRERSTGREWSVLLRASAVLDAQQEPELAINIWHDVTAEHRHEVQTKYLADASSALVSSLASEDMLSKLAHVLVPGLGDWCSIYVLHGDELRRVAAAHASAAEADPSGAQQRSEPADPTHAAGVWSVVRTGRAEALNDIADAALTTSTRHPEALAMLRSAGMKAALLAPIRVRGRIFGVIALASAETARRYCPDELELIEEIGRRAGVALDNAELYMAAQAAAKDAEAASRAKDEFLATVSHELRTPLSAILGWSTLLKDRITDAATLKPIEVIHRNALAQVKIIDDILDVSRVITGKLTLEPKPTDLVGIARDALEAIRPPAAAKKIQLEFAPHADYCLLVADPERLQQLLWNLLSNAVKFTEPGGKVRLALGQERSQVVVIVSDSGIGIAPEFLPVMFERFKQADSSTTRRVGGLGLGLALVRHIAELHGGGVSASSDGPGKGSTFTVTLPIRAVLPASEPPPAPQAASAPSVFRPAVALDGTRVLVVDDEPDARDLVATVLLEAGAEVETARSAAEGYEAFKRFRPHVLVSDIGMPDEDGFSFIRRIRALPAADGSGIPSLALSAFVREDDRTRAISAGYTTHIGKPVNPEALAAAVANLSRVRHRS